MTFRNNELATCFSNPKAARKVLGDQIAKMYRKQIELMLAAPNQLALSRIPQLHFKALAKGSPKEGMYSVRLSGMMRLVLTIDGQTIVVEEVSKHHEE